MNKKFLAVLAALAIFGATGAFATGLGLQAGASVNNDVVGNGAITFKLNNAAPVFALNFAGGTNYLSIGLTADWWLGNPNIAGVLNWYYFVGLAGAVNAAGDNVGGFFGGRFGVGLNMFVVKPFEIYLQAAFQPGVSIWNSGFSFYWTVPVNLGFRFWF